MVSQARASGKYDTPAATSHAIARDRGACHDSNALRPADRAVHDWYRFVLSFPPHLVRTYLARFAIGPEQRVLDSFCGTGTVLVECQKQGIPAVGIEANPMAHFASQVKVDWSPDPDGLASHAHMIARAAAASLARDGLQDAPEGAAEPGAVGALRTLPPESQRLLLANAISALPLHKALVLLETIERLRDDRYERHERLALAAAVVSSSSNLRFGPEVGVGLVRADAPVIAPWQRAVERMAEDLRALRGRPSPHAAVAVHRADARDLVRVLAPRSVDAVITSPPYPNEKDYTRATRLESVLLGFARTPADLRALKRGLVRSNTRTVYTGDDDDTWVADHPEIQRIAAAIERRRIALAKTSGFERLYARVTKLYFGGMARHLAELRAVLRPNAHLAYVVGDQASYFRILIPTGRLLASIAERLGYELVGIDLFRTRLATATRAQLREEVVVLRWPGGQCESA